MSWDELMNAVVLIESHGLEFFIVEDRIKQESNACSFALHAVCKYVQTLASLTDGTTVWFAPHVWHGFR